LRQEASLHGVTLCTDTKRAIRTQAIFLALFSAVATNLGQQVFLRMLGEFVLMILERMLHALRIPAGAPIIARHD
jgi:hypothetical protein